MPKKAQNRHDAYRLTDNESRRRYYDDWAGTYDTEHAQKTGYVYPDTVACRFLELAALRIRRLRIWDAEPGWPGWHSPIRN